MAHDTVSFDCTDDEREAAKNIAARAVSIRRQAGIRVSKGAEMDHMMDLIATHANGNPLDFDKMLAADDFNLAHDVFGIERHLDRSTGELTNFFSPRCSKREQVAA